MDFHLIDCDLRVKIPSTVKHIFVFGKASIRVVFTTRLSARQYFFKQKIER